MYATIQKWGNSHALRIPKPLLESLGLRENDRVEFIPGNDTLSIRKVTAPHKTLEERLTAFYGKPIDEIDRIQTEELDWGGAEGHEVW